MDNPDEYVLQVFRRAQGMLEHELVPEHTAKLLKFGERIAQARDLRAEAECIKAVEGFSIAGIAFEWLNGRAQRDAEFNFGRFDADVHLLYESLRRGFSEVPREPVAAPVPSPAQVPAPEAPAASSVLSEPDWNSGARQSAAAAAQEPAAVPDAAGPSFTDLLDNPMQLTVRRLADSALAFDQKPESERTTSLAVIKMMAKGVVDMARPQNKIVVTTTFQEIAGFAEAVERRGEARAESTAAAMAGLGGILSAALRDTEGGMKYMNKINEFLSIRKVNGAK